MRQFTGDGLERAANPTEGRVHKMLELNLEPYSDDRLGAFLDDTRSNQSDHDLLVRQSTILEFLLKDIKDLKDDLHDKVKDIDVRVGVLEQAYWKLIGAGTVAGAVGGYVAKLIFK